MPDRLAVLPWLWLGAALLFVGVVAPAAFAVLPSRSLAGLLVGRVLPVIFWSGALVAGILVVTQVAWRRAAALTMLAACLAAQVGVAPRIQRLRAQLGPDIETVPAGDERRVAFGRLHGVSVALLGLGMACASVVALGGLAASGGSRRTRPSAAVASRGQTVASS
jgi:Domain of unknown function (DUF4149)